MIFSTAEIVEPTAEDSSSDTVILENSRFSWITRVKSYFRKSFWIGVTLFFLLIFTIVKLPEERLKNYLQGVISSALEKQQISFSMKEGSISLFGISYTMKNITLVSLSSQREAHLDQIEISPSLFGILMGKKGGSFRVVNGKGSLNGNVALGLFGKTPKFFVSLESAGFNVGDTGMLPVFANVAGSVTINGTLEFSGEQDSMATLIGKCNLDLTKISIDQQNMSMFVIPNASVSEGKISFNVEKGKLVIKALQLGKKGKASDDLYLSASGEVGLGKQLGSSTLNLNTNFIISENLMKSLGSLADVFLAPGKKSDGSYGYRITGTIDSPMPLPSGS